MKFGCIVCRKPMVRTIQVDLESIAVCASTRCARKILDSPPKRSHQRAH